MYKFVRMFVLCRHFLDAKVGFFHDCCKRLLMMVMMDRVILLEFCLLFDCQFRLKRFLNKKVKVCIKPQHDHIDTTPG